MTSVNNVKNNSARFGTEKSNNHPEICHCLTLFSMNHSQVPKCFPNYLILPENHFSVLILVLVLGSTGAQSRGWAELCPPLLSCCCKRSSENECSSIQLKWISKNNYTSIYVAFSWPLTRCFQIFISFYHFCKKWEIFALIFAWARGFKQAAVQILPSLILPPGMGMPFCSPDGGWGLPNPG